MREDAAREETRGTLRDRARDLVVVAVVAALARVAGAALVWSLGFRAVSDDDFARVVIAQRFAAAPKLDPTGTSWLPLPFWIVGGAMKVVGSTLVAARVLAVTSAAIAGAFVACVAVAAGLGRRRAMAAAIVAAAMPWGMQLAVATVPEVPAAAFAAAGALALAASSSRLRVVGGIALLASTWSRYDAWPLTVAFAVLTLLDARRARGADRTRLLIAAAIALFGPVSWSLWQRFVFGDAFRYLRLVRSYRRALGAGPSLLQRIVGYPFGVVEEMREVLGAGIVGAVCALLVERRRIRGRTDAASNLHLDPRRPLWLALLQLLVLIAGDVRDGAPTHHPERALLGPATILLFVSADAAGAFVSGLRDRARKVAFVALATAALGGWIALRLHRSLGWYADAPRVRELAAGRALAALPKGTRVLVDTRDFGEGRSDYGYYAVLAAFGRPLDAEIDRDQDPRKPRVPSAFADAASLRARVDGARASAMLSWGDAHRATAESIGAHAVADEDRRQGAPCWSVLVF